MLAPLAIGGAFGSSAGVERQARADAAEEEAADVEDAAEEEAREDRHALRARARDEPELGVQLEDEAGARRAGAAAERVVEAPREAVAEELDLAAEVRRCASSVDACRKTPARREEAVVARVEDEGRAERDRAPVVEEVRERQALEDRDEPRRRPEEGR